MKKNDLNPTLKNQLVFDSVTGELVLADKDNISNNDVAVVSQIYENGFFGDSPKQFNPKHKAIKMPEGAAGEYAKYSCNFYKGCSNECTYCFNNRWKWGNVPTLKKCFKDEAHALEIFEKELRANLPELQKHGLFFSFTTDPMLSKIIGLTAFAIGMCSVVDVPVKILTKRAEWIKEIEICDVPVNHFNLYGHIINISKIAFGFTLTGHDELEPNASTNVERIEAMRKLHEAGFKTWASIEPIIDFESSLNMIAKTMNLCDLYKIGIESGKIYNKQELFKFTAVVRLMVEHKSKIYFKDSLLKAAGIDRSELPSNCVGRDYNIFNS